MIKHNHSRIMTIHCPPFDGQYLIYLMILGRESLRLGVSFGPWTKPWQDRDKSGRISLKESWDRSFISKSWNPMESHWIRSERAMYPRNHWAALACRIGLGLHCHWTTDLESWNSWNISVVKRIAGFLCRWWLGSSGLNADQGCWLHHPTGLGQDSWAH